MTGLVPGLVFAAALGGSEVPLPEVAHASIATVHPGCEARKLSSFPRLSFFRYATDPSAVAPCT